MERGQDLISVIVPVYNIKEYLERCAQGDLEARNILVEHNLRLVAHIVKKG